MIIGIILIIIGIFSLYKSSLSKRFYESIENAKKSDYKQIIGTVICDAYAPRDVDKLNKPVTPIVEYEVNGQKYETQNPFLETDAELPVGTKVYVWYKKSNPKIAVLGTEIWGYFHKRTIGIALILFGLMFTAIGF